MCHHTQLVCFHPGWTWALIFLISTWATRSGQDSVSNRKLKLSNFHTQVHPQLLKYSWNNCLLTPCCNWESSRNVLLKAGCFYTLFKKQPIHQCKNLFFFMWDTDHYHSWTWNCNHIQKTKTVIIFLLRNQLHNINSLSWHGFGICHL
jgi:hypothetical protein